MFRQITRLRRPAGRSIGRAPVWMAVLALASCRMSSDFSGTTYQCGADGACPEGQRCVDLVCVLVGPAADAADAPPPADAPPGPAYLHRRAITVEAGSSAIPDGYSIAVSLDHAALVTEGKARADGADLRVVCDEVERARVLDDMSAWQAEETRIWFKLPTAVEASTTYDGCALHYGAPDAPDPAPSWSDSMGADDPSEVFWYADDFEEHAGGTDPDGWTDQGVEDTKVVLHGSERWLRAMTSIDWRDGATASAMATIDDSVASARLYYWQAGDNAWGGIGVRQGNGSDGLITIVRDGEWQVFTAGFATGSDWQPDPGLHFSLGTQGRLEVLVAADRATAYWYNEPGLLPVRTELFADLALPLGTGKLEVHIERPVDTNERWVDIDNIVVRRYVSPEPSVVLGEEENL